MLLRELIHLNLDVILVTETWLRDTPNDQLWIKSCDFNKPPYQCHHANRHAKTGGRLMLICKSKFDVKQIAAENTISFEHASWSLSLNNKSITVTGIYHPLQRLVSPMLRLLTTLLNIYQIYLQVSRTTSYWEISTCTWRTLLMLKPISSMRP